MRDVHEGVQTLGLTSHPLRSTRAELGVHSLLRAGFNPRAGIRRVRPSNPRTSESVRARREEARRVFNERKIPSVGVKNPKAIARREMTGGNLRTISRKMTERRVAEARRPGMEERRRRARTKRAVKGLP